MKKRNKCCNLLLGLLCMVGICQGEPLQIKAIPTFISCSIYVTGSTGTDCQVQFRPWGSRRWQTAFPLYQDSVRKEFRGSLVRLKENTSYEVKAVVKGQGEVQTSFRTWNSCPAVKQELKLSDFLPDRDGSLRIEHIKGTPDGWIRIWGDVPVHAGTAQEAALWVDHCEYVIFEHLVMTGGQRHGIRTGEHTKNVRFSNCDISAWGRKPVRQDSRGHYLDDQGREINNDGGFTVYRSQNVVLEKSYIHDPNGYTNPWKGVISLGEWEGQEFANAHPQGPNAVYVMESGGGLVLRYNDLVGSQTHRYNDPIEGWQNREVNGGLAKDADIYGNVLAFGQDDAIELDGGQCNVRLFDNRMEQIYCGVSTAPNRKGPSYIFQNVIWNMGNSEGATGNAIKNGGGDEFTAGTQYLFHNTIIHRGGGMAGVGYGNGARRELFVGMTRNNIFYSQLDPARNPRKGYNIYDPHRDARCDFDYDMLGNSTQSDGRGRILAVEGAEQHGIYAAPLFADLSRGVLTLKGKDPGMDKGEVLPGFSVKYKGKAPDLGAFEQSASSLFPVRPVDWEADRYLVSLQEGKEEEVRIKCGKVKASFFRIDMSEDMKSWLQVTCSASEVRNHGVLILTFAAIRSEKYPRKGMVFLRLPNGYSLPVTVTMEEK